MAEFFGNTISNFINKSGNFVFAIMIMALFAKVILIILENSYYKSIKLNIELEPFVYQIKKRCGKNTDEAARKITKLLMNNKCSLLGGAFDSIFLFFIAVCFFLTIRDPQYYIFSDVTVENFSRGFVLYPDLTKSLIKYYAEIGASSQFILYLILPAAAFSFEYSFDRYILNKSIIMQDKMYYVIWALYAVALVLCGGMFSIFLISKRALDSFQLFYYMKFYKVKAVIDVNGKRRNLEKTEVNENGNSKKKEYKVNTEDFDYEETAKPAEEKKENKKK